MLRGGLKSTSAAIPQTLKNIFPLRTDWHQLKPSSRQQRDQCHLVKRQLAGDAGTPAGAERQISLSGRRQRRVFCEALREKALRLREIACIVVKEPRADPDCDVAIEFEAAELEGAFHLSIENG